MKILHLISGGDTGGAKTHIFTLMKSLQKYADVKVLCFIHDTFFDDALKAGIPIELMEQKSRLDLSVVKKIATKVKEEQYDIVHCHGARANFVGYFLRKRIAVPMITTIHSDTRLDFKGSAYKQLIYRQLNERSLRVFDYYLTVSDEFKSMLIERGFSEERIFVVYNGIDTEMQTEPTSHEDFARKYHLPITYDGPVFVIAARFDVVKNVEMYVKAAKQYLADGYAGLFLIAGEGPQADMLHDLAQGEERIRFLGFVKDIPGLFHYADVNVLTSLSESFPYVIMEAGLQQKPTVSSAVGGIDRIVLREKTGDLFAVNDIDHLVSIMKRYADHPERILQHGHAMHQLILEKFSAEAMAKTHLEIYRRILEQKIERLLISGYFGFDNSGDDAILKSMVTGIRSRFPTIEMEVLTNDPKKTWEQVGVAGVNRFSPLQVRRALKRSDMLISGGGSLLQDVTSTRSLWYYLWVLRLGLRLHKDVYIFANGIGPINGRLNRRLTKKTLNRVDYITLRDEDSYDYVKALGITHPTVEVTADPVLSMELITQDEIDQVWQKEGLPTDAPILGVSIRPWEKEDFKALAEGLQQFLAQNSTWHIVMIPLHEPADRELQQKFLAYFAAFEHRVHMIQGVHAGDKIAGMISNMDALIAMRLHAVIYGAVAGTPVFPLSYDPKVDAMRKPLGLPYYASVNAFDVQEFNQSLAQFMAQRETIRSAIHQGMTALRKAVDRNFSYIEKAPPKPYIVEIMGVQVSSQSFDAIWSRMTHHLEEEKYPLAIYTPNPEIVMECRKNADLRALINRGDLITPDGIGLVYAAKMRKRYIPGRVTGFDLSIKLLEEGHDKGLTFYFLGGKPGVAEKAAEMTREKHPGIKAIHYHHGYFKGVPTGEPGHAEEKELVEEMRRLKPDVIFVGLGFPKQELFIDLYKDVIQAKVSIGNGGVMNILAGEAKRAPEWAIKMNLEWLYRLIKEPSRFKRQLALPHFMWTIMRDKKSVR